MNVSAQMMAILFGEMLQFGLVLGTIMMGFTVSFFALFGDRQSYGEVGDRQLGQSVDGKPAGFRVKLQGASMLMLMLMLIFKRG